MEVSWSPAHEETAEVFPLYPWPLFKKGFDVILRLLLFIPVNNLVNIRKVIGVEVVNGPSDF